MVIRAPKPPKPPKSLNEQPQTPTPKIMPSQSITLAHLPDDILLTILSNLDAARELRALALSCHRLHRLVASEGWRVFVRNRFASLTIPMPTTKRQRWNELASSLTWQSRCWDKRSLQFQGLMPREASSKKGGRNAAARVSRAQPFQPVVDAYYDPDTREELVVWGAGEDIVARYRQKESQRDKTKVEWHIARGKEGGFKAGYDDVRAIVFVKDHVVRGEGGERRVILAGRDNGDLALLSAEGESFGKRLVRFAPTPPPEDAGTGEEGGLPPLRQDTINSLDILRSGGRSVVAAATKSGVMVYQVPDEEKPAEVNPLATYDMREMVGSSTSMQLCRAKWMARGDILALALKGCREPLRYLQVTPSGYTYYTAAKNPRFNEEYWLEDTTNICPNSLQPVNVWGAGMGGLNLTLSAWRDGSCR